MIVIPRRLGSAEASALQYTPTTERSEPCGSTIASFFFDYFFKIPIQFRLLQHRVHDLDPVALINHE